MNPSILDMNQNSYIDVTLHAQRAPNMNGHENGPESTRSMVAGWVGGGVLRNE